MPIFAAIPSWTRSAGARILRVEALYARLLIAASLISGVGVTVVGCTNDGAQLTVDLKTDLIAGVEFATVRTELLDAEARAGMESAQIESVVVSSRIDFVRGRRVADFATATPRDARVRVTLLDGAGSTLVQRTVRLALEGSYALTVIIARDCVGVSCPGPGDIAEATACMGGRCVPPECLSPGSDRCGPSECRVDGECAAAVSCAEGRCVEGVCLQQALHERCFAGDFCSIERGCVQLPAGDDAGVAPDAGTSDAGGMDAGRRDAGARDAGTVGPADAPFDAVFDAAACVASPECEPGNTQTRPCGNLCGYELRVCSSRCTWGSWSSACMDEGECDPDDDPETRVCGMCGEQSRACSDTCAWRAWSSCEGEGTCVAGSTTTAGCNACEARACTASCELEVSCSLCSGGPGCSSGERCDDECPAGMHVTHLRHTDGCGLGLGVNTIGCAPNCGERFFQCDDGCPADYHVLRTLHRDECGIAGGRNSAECERNAGPTFDVCDDVCPASYHVIRREHRDGCGIAAGTNSVQCERDEGDSFYVCGSSCPALYHETSIGHRDACGIAAGNNSVVCARD